MSRIKLPISLYDHNIEMQIGNIIAAMLLTLATYGKLVNVVSGNSELNSITIDSVSVYETFYSIGVEFLVTGDLNHNSSNPVFTYLDAGVVKSFLPMARSLYKCKWIGNCYQDSLVNKWAGSIMYLTPNTEYKLHIVLVDPDGGGIDTTFTVTTDALPTKTPIGTGRTTYNNFSRPGYYDLGGDTLQVINIFSDSIYLDNFVLYDSLNNDAGIHNPGNLPLNHITIKNAQIYYFKRGIEVNGNHWYIDSVYYHGACAEFACRSDYTGIHAVQTPNDYKSHSLTISNFDADSVGDAISLTWGGHTGSYNVDIFNCRIDTVGDDGIELDGAQSNVRVWNNLIYNPRYHGISAQPQASGPWYIINNYIEGFQYSSALKLMAVDIMFIIGNHFIQNGVEDANNTDVAVIRNAHQLFRCYLRNNIYEYKGERRGRGLNSYVWYANSDQEGFTHWRTNHNGDVFIWPKANPNIFQYSFTPE